MKDKFGNELFVGDEVFYAIREGQTGYGIAKGIISGFTETLVKFEDTNSKVSPYKVGKVIK